MLQILDRIWILNKISKTNSRCSSNNKWWCNSKWCTLNRCNKLSNKEVNKIKIRDKMIVYKTHFITHKMTKKQFSKCNKNFINNNKSKCKCTNNIKNFWSFSKWSNQIRTTIKFLLTNLINPNKQANNNKIFPHKISRFLMIKAKLYIMKILMLRMVVKLVNLKNFWYFWWNL